jgi:hypothetical protein
VSGIQTNFRAEDMLGGAKQEVVAPKKVAAPKVAPKKVEAVVEAPVVEEVVETAPAVEEPAAEEAGE